MAPQVPLLPAKLFGSVGGAETVDLAEVCRAVGRVCDEERLLSGDGGPQRRGALGGPKRLVRAGGLARACARRQHVCVGRPR